MPFSAPPHFDVDSLIDIASNRAAEAQDELWLLQTDLEYFYERAKYYERRWFDKVPGLKETRSMSNEEKYDNVAYIVTIRALDQATKWQWIVEECQIVKQEFERSAANICAGKPLPQRYDMALNGLKMQLSRIQINQRDTLLRLLLRSPAFQHMFKINDTGEFGWAGWTMEVDLKDQSTFMNTDRVGWCLFHLSKAEEIFATIDHSLILQHLDDFLENLSHKEMVRIDQEIYRCLSELVALRRMLNQLDLHRPTLGPADPSIMQQRRPAWQCWMQFMKYPKPRLCSEMGLHSAFVPLSNFCPPKGRKDEKWIEKRDAGYKTLSELWAKARKEHQIALEMQRIPRSIIDAQLKMMRQCDSMEHKTRLESERQQILSRLQAAAEAVLVEQANKSSGDVGTFPQAADQPDKYLPQASPKTKKKTRAQQAMAKSSAMADKKT